MAFSVNTPVGDGVTKQFAVNFTNGIFSRDSVHVFVEGEVDGLGDPIERTFTWINDGLIELDGDAPASGLVIEIRRIMDKDEPAVDFEDGEILTEETMDRSVDHLLNSIHELLDGYGFSSIQTDINMNGYRVVGLGAPQNPDDAARVSDIAESASAAVLRQELGSSDDGSNLVAHTGTANTVTETLDQNIADINQRVIHVATVAAMRALTGLLDGQAINLTAYRSGWAATVAGPKGGGQFVVDTSDTTTVDDGGTTFVTSGGVRIKRKDYQSITFEMFGAYGDGTNNDQPFMQAAIDSKAAERFPIIMDDAVYGVESQVSGRSDISILGSSPSDSIIKALTGFAGGGSILRFNAVDSFITGVTCQDFRIDCNNQSAHGFEMVRAYDANKVSNVWSINTADAHSSFRFVGLTDAGPVDIGQTLLCERLYAGHANATATSPTIFLERLQESVFIECKAWGVLSGSKAPANPWVLQDCRSVTLVQPSATSTTGFGIRVLTSTKDSSGIAIISPLYENVDDLLETLDVGGFSIVGLSHTSPRFQSPIDAAAEFLLQDCNSCTLETLSQNVTIGATCVATEIKTVDSTKVTNGSSTSTIIQRSNATNLRQKIITEGGISVLNSDESVEMLRTSVPSSGVVGVLLAVNRSGTTTLDTVTIGSPDSGGSGFRVLRVAN